MSELFPIFALILCWLELVLKLNIVGILRVVVFLIVDLLLVEGTVGVVVVVVGRHGGEAVRSGEGSVVVVVYVYAVYVLLDGFGVVLLAFCLEGEGMLHFL